MANKQLGIAILGCGYWGINYCRIFSELTAARLLAVCDQRQERLDEVKRRFPHITVSTAVDEVLNLPGVDAVVVCTPAATHSLITRSCLLAGKHVLVEKPITTASSEVDELSVLARAQGLTLMVGHTFLYNRAVQTVKQYIQQAKLGRVYYLYAARTNLGPIRHDVNAIWDLAPHDVSIFNYLLESTPIWVSAVGAKVLHNTREDVGFISLGYPNDIVGHIHVSWADPNKVREIVAVGSNKRIVFNDMNSLEPVRIFDKGIAAELRENAQESGFPYHIRDGDIISPRIELSEPLKNECIHFVECTLEGTEPLSGANAGRQVVEVMEAIDRSMACNGAPVTVEPNYRPFARPLVPMAIESLEPIRHIDYVHTSAEGV